MAEVGRTTFTAIARFAELRREARGAADDLRGLQGAALDAGRGGRDGGRDLERMGRTMQDLGGKTQKAGRWMTTRLSLPIVSSMGLAVKAFSDFDDAMVQSLAIMGDVAPGLRDQMETTAREIARTTTVSAAEAAESYFFLASAGLDAEQSIAALPQVAAFAQAGMFDMAVATDLATDAQSALGLTSKDAQENLENLTRVTDTLVGANTLANASVEQFSEALTAKAGARMRALNIDLEDGVAVLAAFADQGIKGSKAGNTLDAVYRDLTRAAVVNQEAFEAQGIAVFDAQGNLRNMADVTADFERVLGPMSDEMKVATLNGLGLTAMAQTGVFALLGSSEAVRGYSDDLKDMGGITQDVAERQLESFQAKMGLLRDRLKDVAITVGQQIVPFLLELMETVAKLAERFADMGPAGQKFVLAMAAVIAVGGPLLMLFGGVAGAIGKMITLFSTIRTAAVVGKLGALSGAVSGVMTGASGLATFLLGPWGLALAGAGLAVYGLMQWLDRMNEGFVTSKEAAETLAESTADLEWGDLTDGLAAYGDGADEARAQVQDFVAANGELLQQLRATSNEEGQALLLQMGFQLVMRGNDPEEVATHLNELREQAGIPVEFEIDASQLTDASVLLGTIEITLGRMSRTWDDKAFFVTVSDSAKDAAEEVGDLAGAMLRVGDTDTAMRAIAMFADELGELGLTTGANRDLQEELFTAIGNSSGVWFEASTSALEFGEILQQMASGEVQGLPIQLERAALMALFLAETTGEELTPELFDAQLALIEEAQAADEAGGDLEDLADDSADLMEAQRLLEEALNAATTAIKEQVDQIRAAADPVFAHRQAMEKLQEAQENWTAVMADTESTQREQEQATIDLTNAMLDERYAAAEAAGKHEELMAMLTLNQEELGLTEEQLRIMETALVDSKTRADELAATHMAPTAELNDAELRNGLREANTQLDALGNRHPVPSTHLQDAELRNALRTANTELDRLGRRSVSPSVNVRLNLPALPTGLSWGSNGLPRVPRSHSGGGVDFDPSREVLRILEKGEGVVSADGMKNLERTMQPAGVAPGSMATPSSSGFSVQGDLVVNNPTGKTTERSLLSAVDRVRAIGAV